MDLWLNSQFFWSGALLLVSTSHFYFALYLSIARQKSKIKLLTYEPVSQDLESCIFFWKNIVGHEEVQHPQFLVHLRLTHYILRFLWCQCMPGERHNRTHPLAEACPAVFSPQRRSFWQAPCQFSEQMLPQWGNWCLSIFLFWFCPFLLTLTFSFFCALWLFSVSFLFSPFSLFSVLPVSYCCPSLEFSSQRLQSSLHPLWWHLFFL